MSGGVKLDAVELRRIRLPLIRPFATAHGTVAERDVLLVHVLGPDGEGWGECAAEVTPQYWYETVDTASQVLQQWLVPAGTPAIVGHPMAKAALEMATLDATLRAEGRPLAEALGGRPGARLLATTTIGLHDEVDELLTAGYRSVKAKIDHHRWPPSLPSGVLLQVDANGSLDPIDAIRLDDAGLLAIEQPLATDNLVGHADLARRMRTPICLDESLWSLGAIDTAIALRACRMACIKPSRLGGLRIAVAAAARCAAAGIDAKVGGMLESGVGRAAALALASNPAFAVPPDLSATDRYYAEDITEPFVLDPDGRLTVPSGPGLGVEVRKDVLDRLTLSTELVRP